MLTRLCNTSTRSTSKEAHWRSMSCSFSINPIRSPDGTPPVMIQWVVGHLGASVECGKVWGQGHWGDFIQQAATRLRRLTHHQKKAHWHRAFSGTGEVTGGSTGDPRMDGDVDIMTDNVGVDREVNAGDTITWTSGVEAGEMSMTIGESPEAKYVWGVLSGGEGPISVAIPWSSDTSGGVPFTTNLWSSLGGAGGVAGRKPGRQGGTTRMTWRWHPRGTQDLLHLYQYSILTPMGKTSHGRRQGRGRETAVSRVPLMLVSHEVGQQGWDP